MRSEDEKGLDEIRVFETFLTLSELRISSSSVEKRLPPEPDLLCMHDIDGKVGFELVELCDLRLARAIADPRPDAGGTEYIRTSDPTLMVLKKKLRRNYDTLYPVELLCYTAGRIITPTNIIRPTIGLLLGSACHAFRRVWLMANGEVCELWASAQPDV